MRKNIILLVGPSGAGKSTIIDSLPNIVKTYKTDNLTVLRLNVKSIGDVNHEARFYEAKKIIEELYGSTNVNVVDIGAGAIDHDTEWFKQFYKICIMNRPEIMQLDRIKHHPTLEGYNALEFSEKRKSLYNSAHSTVDTETITVEQAVKMVCKCVSKIVES